MVTIGNKICWMETIAMVGPCYIYTAYNALMLETFTVDGDHHLSGLDIVHCAIFVIVVCLMVKLLT